MTARLPAIAAMVLAATAATAAPSTVPSAWPYGAGAKAQAKAAPARAKAVSKAKPAQLPAKPRVPPAATAEKPAAPPQAAARSAPSLAPLPPTAAAKPFAPPAAAPQPRLAVAPGPGGELSAQDLDRASVGLAAAEESLEASRTAQVRERTLLDAPGLEAGPAARTPAEQAPVRAADLPNLDLRVLTGPN